MLGYESLKIAMVFFGKDLLMLEYELG